MRAVFGVVSLMIVVALVGLLAGRQLRAMRGEAPPASAGAASAPVTVRQQSLQIQDKVVNDVTKALEQGAARKEEADK
ncbi:MAG: hypothetical protein ABI605_08350 [Rhizobacter sp.]